MREILVYDDYEIHKLSAGGGTQYEEVTTEKATSIYVTDVAKIKGKLIPFGRTMQNEEPSPENSIDIENVEGNIDIKVCNKNLWGGFTYDKTKYGVRYIQNADGSMLINGTATQYSTSIDVNVALSDGITKTLPAGTYVLSGGKGTGYGINIQVLDENSNSLVSTKTSKSFTLTEETKILVRVAINTGTELDNELIKIQLEEEEGTTATSYEEHKEQTYNINLGNIELCKIGNYEDYFLKENEKWYLYKATGKSIIDGNTKFSYSQQTNNIFYSSSATDGVAITNNVPFCTHYKGENNVHNAGQASAKGNNSIMFKDYDSVTYIVDNRFTTVADLKGWLATNNVTIYYGLATPVVTEITDATMIEQLEALSNLLLYKGVNHIWTETDGLEPNLQLTYKRKKQSNTLQVSNIQPLNNLELNNTEETPEEITTEISEE